MSKALQTLGLHATASPQEIKARWRELCMRAHPDRGGSAERFIQINRAYEEAYADAMNLNCSECSGTGTVSKSRGWAVIKMTCPDCGGTGKPWAELKE